MRAPEIARIGPEALEAAADGLARILAACVADGASVGFVQPFGENDARRYWEGEVFPAVRSGAVILWGARAGGDLVGTVQLIPSPKPNQTHRADVAKLLVHPEVRRRGIGRALMGALEQAARGRGLDLLVLDTRTPDAAEHLYRALGWLDAGPIPGYAIAAEDPARRDATLFMFRPLRDVQNKLP